ncbi:hypothetical protein KQJ29_33855, partial [Enterococcus sp. S181_ASV_20]|nr:hypothetical protein [Enterococcus sp. S181_ASV_20]
MCIRDRYQNHIKRYPEIENLLQELRSSLTISPDNELLLKKAFLPFIRSTWGDMQLFQPDPVSYTHLTLPTKL